MRVLFAAAILACALTVARAEERAVLRLEDVLASAAERYPAVLEAIAAQRAAEGRALASRGAFDTVIAAESEGYLSGFYDGSKASVRAEQALGPFGARAYGGYRVSRGDFPTYKDEAFTDRAGEASAGIVLSLLRDRAIDQRRFGVRDADLAAEAAETDTLLARLAVQEQAATAYFRWVAAVRRLEVYEGLVRLAEDRQSALVREVEAGARARVFLTENAQTLARRRVIALDAAQAVDAAAIALSLYLRNADGEGIVARREQAPRDRGDPSTAFRDAEAALLAEASYARRPDLARLELDVERARNRVALARNDFLPRLDFSYEVANDFGAEGVGGSSRDGVENIVGLRFSVPLQQRDARGRLKAAEAELEAVEQRRRLAADRVAIAIETLSVNLEAARERVALVAAEVEQSAEMENAERRRFAAGASDFFLVNLREEAAADARARLHAADFERSAAFAAYLAATVNLDGLGL